MHQHQPKADVAHQQALYRKCGAMEKKGSDPNDAENEQYEEHLVNAHFYQRGHIAKAHQLQIRRWKKRERKQRHREKHLNYKIGQTTEVLRAERDDLLLRKYDVFRRKECC